MKLKDYLEKWNKRPLLEEGKPYFILDKDNKQNNINIYSDYLGFKAHNTTYICEQFNVLNYSDLIALLKELYGYCPSYSIPYPTYFFNDFKAATRAVSYLELPIEEKASILEEIGLSPNVHSKVSEITISISQLSNKVRKLEESNTHLLTQVKNLHNLILESDTIKKKGYLGL